VSTEPDRAARRKRWDLHPWRTIRELREDAESMRAALVQLTEEAGRQHKANAKLKADNGALRDQVRRLLKPDVPEGVTDMGLDFVMVGFDRGPGLGKRLMASRDLGKTAFGMTEMDDPPPRWKIQSVMANMVVMDERNHPDAMARLFGIWASQDEAKAADEAARTEAASREH
jgi:hypothetical protein